MDINIKWRRATVLALASVTLLSLTACAPGAPLNAASTTDSTTSAVKEARLVRHVHVCFENTSSGKVSLTWTSGVSTTGGSGALDSGQQLCAEGPEPMATVTFSDSFATNVRAVNPLADYPWIFFKPNPTRAGIDYTSAQYAQGESVNSDVQGHHFSVTRKADDDWINFAITILD